MELKENEVLLPEGTKININGFEAQLLSGPKIFGKITNDLVYERLTANVLKHLQELNPKDEKGRRKHKHFQRLTSDIGHPELRALLSSEITVMRGFDDGQWNEFYKFLNRVLPKQTPLPLFDDLPEQYLTKDDLK
jgi:P63C domain